MRRMVIAALRPLPWLSFVEASSGLEAIERLMLDSIDLLVIDVNMPEMNGIETIKFLRRHPTYKGLPVIILTTRGDDDTLRKASELDVIRYLTKPFAPTAFAREIATVLGIDVEVSLGRD